LLDSALLNGGYHINEGKGFNDRMMRSIKRNFGTGIFDLLPEIDPKVEEDVPPEASGINLEDFLTWMKWTSTNKNCEKPK